MSNYQLSISASRDLGQIHEYIARDNLTAANELIAGLRQTLKTLSENPYLGSRQDELRARMRLFTHESYVICYFPTDDGIRVARVLHGARNIIHLFPKRRKRE